MREIFSGSCERASAQAKQRHCQFSTTQEDSRDKEGRTMIQVVLEAHTDFSLRVRSDGQPRFTIDILLVQVHVLLRTRVDNLNVDALVEARCNVRGNNNERIHVCRVPNAF